MWISTEIAGGKKFFISIWNENDSIMMKCDKNNERELYLPGLIKKEIIKGTKKTKIKVKKDSIGRKCITLWENLCEVLRVRGYGAGGGERPIRTKRPSVIMGRQRRSHHYQNWLLAHWGNVFCCSVVIWVCVGCGKEGVRSVFVQIL